MPIKPKKTSKASSKKMTVKEIEASLGKTLIKARQEYIKKHLDTPEKIEELVYSHMDSAMRGLIAKLMGFEYDFGHWQINPHSKWSKYLNEELKTRLGKAASKQIEAALKTWKPPKDLKKAIQKEATDVFYETINSRTFYAAKEAAQRHINEAFEGTKDILEEIGKVASEEEDE
jgi:hypothetical protein